MKKLFTVLALAMFSAPAMAQTHVCVNEGNTVMATFSKVEGQDMKVRLNISQDQIHGQSLAGTCQPMEGAIEAAYFCHLGGSVAGYNVRFESTGGPQMVATVESWSMRGRHKLATLLCTEPF